VEEGGRDGEKEGIWKIAFWNVAGLSNKDKDFWRGIKEWDVVTLSETWVDEKGWDRVRGKLPRGYEWGVQFAKRRSKKGRAIGGMLMGIRKVILEKGKGIGIEREGMMVGRIRQKKESWRVVGVYVGEGLEKTLKGLEKWMEEKEEGVLTIVGGDFNARTGNEGGGVEVIEESGRVKEEKSRRSKDEKINGEGRKLLNFLGERGWHLFNGNVRGDEDGEFTFTGGKGNTVIDYVMGEEEVKERIDRLRVGDRIDSDHHPVEVWMKGAEKKRRGSKRQEGYRRGVWDDESCKKFRERLGKMESGEEDVEIIWEEMEEKVKRVLLETEKGRENEGRRGRRGWWDKECEEKKKGVRKELRNWRKKGGEGRDYKRRKQEYRELCEEKKRKENARWERSAMDAKRESEVWEILNSERKKISRIHEGIEMEEWEEHFKRLLGGVENRVVRGDKRRSEKMEEKDISKEEIRGIIRKIKDGKAAGLDGLPGEIWKYGGKR